MSSLMICPKCGGTIGSTVPGKRGCTCARDLHDSVAAATAEAHTATATEVKKVCSVCGKDVTHQKRIKDSTTGQYWCYSCGSSDAARHATPGDDAARDPGNGPQSGPGAGAHHRSSLRRQVCVSADGARWASSPHPRRVRGA